jgi:geranylgeranyl pyrophosphate synthase/GT2 family glycosyltransferase
VLATAKTGTSISVILSVHNGGAPLRECLASLARHREQFSELIIVDDGSTDDAIAFPEEFGARVLKVGSRKGPANGRNLGALAASSEILLFLDADICISETTIPRIRRRFEQEAELGAVFGSYDNSPRATQLVSQFRNLLHYFVHQTSREHASTFWSGCGAIRREIFLQSAGFDASYANPSVEDIELGSRLVSSGVRIALDPLIQVNHLKRWTLRKMVMTDVWWRGMYWTRLILAAGSMPNDLNLRYSSRISVALTGLLCLLAAAGLFSWYSASLIPIVLISILALNARFYRFLAIRSGYGFAAASLPLHLLYFFCCGAGFCLGVGAHCYSRLTTPRRPILLPHPALAISTEDTGITIESALRKFLPQSGSGNNGALDQALQYALFPGGKRLRPRLTILSARIFGVLDERVLRAACAVEFVHASSLIIDDLPCMDDADLRRGKPPLHHAFGEDVALLAAIALLNQAYALFAGTPELIREAVECIGLDGMIGGQELDLSNNDGEGSLDARDRKTSALMRLSLTAGPLAIGASHEEVGPLAAAGHQLGRAYQIADDLLDSSVPNHTTGKTTGQDLRHGRPNHNARIGIDARYDEVWDRVQAARQGLLEAFGPKDEVAAIIGFIDTLFAAHRRNLSQAC